MKIEKWRQIVEEELLKINKGSLNHPMDWKDLRPLMLDFMEALDDVSEVFLIEEGK